MRSEYMSNMMGNSQFTWMRSGVTRLGLIALIGTMITVSVHCCKESKDYYDRGVARLEKREHDAAISDLTKAIEMRPRFAMAHFYRGRAYMGKSEYDMAISDFTEAIKIAPELAVAYSERALVYYIEKDYDNVWENIHKQESLGLEARPGFLKALREASGRTK